MTFTATDPRNGRSIGAAFAESGRKDVQDACAAADACAPLVDPPVHLRAVADGLDASAKSLVAHADRETALGTDVLTAELARTTGQLRLFADHVEAGRHLDVVHQAAEGVRPDLVRRHVPIGPVAVFGASNFPLAFGVAGTDTASALAAGCPVVAKGHPSHPSTSRLCADVLEACLPAGYFSLLQGTSHEVGAWLVEHEAIRAVAFTGSLRGGRALFDLGSARRVPIPVYAEMGSSNPVFVTHEAVAERGRDIAHGLVGSVTMRSGQMCTKPGVVFTDSPTFPGLVREAAADVEVGPLLNRQLLDAFVERLATVLDDPGISVLHTGPRAEGLHHPLTVLEADIATVRANPELLEEIFGPACLVVVCKDFESVPVPNSLTGTIHAADAQRAESLAALLTPHVGRLVFDQFPTGVAVAEAMHHGGPYPASTQAAFTSVGPAAIRRFLRPITLQNAPHHLRSSSRSTTDAVSA